MVVMTSYVQRNYSHPPSYHPGFYQPIKAYTCANMTPESCSRSRVSFEFHTSLLTENKCFISTVLVLEGSWGNGGKTEYKYLVENIAMQCFS